MSKKTNAIRLLDSNKINYKLMSYDAPDGFLDGVSVALATGVEPARVFKTLVTQGTSKEYYVCIVPVALELDLKKAAKFFKEKKLEMIPSKEITKVTGYIKGGCSPISMKKQYKTAIDISASDFDYIVVSAGKVGLQVELPVSDLIKITNAHLVDLK
ncbi:MAG: Cys-tRNA(Pro) deacylase [Clostridiales bacterium]|jgi:Cys-tRNA(Pro)/Cys-tRNA(Cys) deacylase|nr:Cys-tRNA(Pro) deacylase [Clostridiales bacterium]